MGKAAEKRKRSRRIYLSKLAQDDPERFEHEWAKRINSWADEIWTFKQRGKIQGPAAFQISDRAKQVLLECGNEAIKLQFKETKEILENECCQVLSLHIGHEIYKINQAWKDKKGIA